MQLIELLDQLRLRKLETEQQLLEIRRLKSQLHTSYRKINDLLEERDRKNLELQQINEDLHAFAQTVSHDLRSPLQNIGGLANAIKYHDRPHKGCIDMYHQAPGEGLKFVVQDDGPGIPQEYQQQIFQSYETGGHDLGRSYSTGLGLAIVQKIVKNKEGRVWVESEGRGARFMFTWPATEVVAEKES